MIMPVGNAKLASALGLTRAQAIGALGAARAVVEAEGPASPRGERLLEVVAGALELEDGWRSVPHATSSQIGAAFDSPTGLRALLDSLLIAACIEEKVTAAGEQVIRALARDLDVHSHWVDLLTAMRRRRVLAIKRALFSRSPDARRVLARTWAEEGLVGLWRALGFVLGFYRDAPLAQRFGALGKLAEGTVGKTFYDHFTARALAFPGERGGMPERMVHHDLMHVINGYGTDATGECELAGFYAGFADGDAFTFLVIALTTFQLGLPVSPTIVEPVRGAFDPARVLAAFLRGRTLQVDIMGPWDYWQIMPLPLAEARQQLGIATLAEMPIRGAGRSS